jgi:leucyl/phenylalanyl-tRNA--protein transferase
MRPVAIGGELSPENVLAATRKGIFPWYETPGRPQWYCPDLRCVFFVDSFKPSKSLQQAYRKQQWTLMINTSFRDVMLNCAGNGREGETWILPEMIDTYCRIHQMGYAHSFEVWRQDQLVGGLYGISLGRIFCGESMFSIESNTSKFAFWQLVEHVKKLGFKCIDAQVPNQHLISMGATMISKEHYIHILNEALRYPDLLGKEFAEPSFSKN